MGTTQTRPQSTSDSTKEWLEAGSSRRDQQCTGRGGLHCTSIPLFLSRAVRLTCAPELQAQVTESARVAVCSALRSPVRSLAPQVMCQLCHARWHLAACKTSGQQLPSNIPVCNTASLKSQTLAQVDPDASIAAWVFPAAFA